MKKLIIKEYWNKVIPDKSSPFGSRVLSGEYEQKSSTSYPNEKRSIKEFQFEAKHKHGFMELVPNGAKFDLGTQYGIHSFQIVTIEEN